MLWSRRSLSVRRRRAVCPALEQVEGRRLLSLGWAIGGSPDPQAAVVTPGTAVLATSSSPRPAVVQSPEPGGLASRQTLAAGSRSTSPPSQQGADVKRTQRTV